MICICKVWIILKNIYPDRSFVRTSEIFFHIARKEKKTNTKNCSQILFYRNNDKKRKKKRITFEEVRKYGERKPEVKFHQAYLQNELRYSS